MVVLNVGKKDIVRLSVQRMTAVKINILIIAEIEIRVETEAESEEEGRREVKKIEMAGGETVEMHAIIVDNRDISPEIAQHPDSIEEEETLEEEDPGEDPEEDVTIVERMDILLENAQTQEETEKEKHLLIAENI